MTTSKEYWPSMFLCVLITGCVNHHASNSVADERSSERKETTSRQQFMDIPISHPEGMVCDRTNSWSSLGDLSVYNTLCDPSFLPCSHIHAMPNAKTATKWIAERKQNGETNAQIAKRLLNLRHNMAACLSALKPSRKDTSPLSHSNVRLAAELDASIRPMIQSLTPTDMR